MLVDLPFELLVDVVALLPVHDMFALGCTCTLFRDSLRDWQVSARVLQAQISSRWATHPALLPRLAYLCVQGEMGALAESPMSPSPLTYALSYAPPVNDSDHSSILRITGRTKMMAKALAANPTMFLYAVAGLTADQADLQSTNGPTNALQAGVQVIDLESRRTLAEPALAAFLAAEDALSSLSASIALKFDMDALLGHIVDDALGAIARILAPASGYDASDSSSGSRSGLDHARTAFLQGTLTAVLSSDAADCLVWLADSRLDTELPGWSTRAIRVQDRLSTFPLHVAAFNSAARVTQAILTRTKPAALPVLLDLRESMYGQTAFHVAIQRDSPPFLVVAELLASGANLDDPDRHGLLPENLIMWRSSRQSSQLRAMLQAARHELDPADPAGSAGPADA